MNLKFKVLCTAGNIQRIENVGIMKKQLPALHVVMCNKESVFDEFVKSFDIEDEYDGLVLFEDDVLLCRDFLRRLRITLSGHENEVVSMFEGPCARGKMYSGYKSGRQFMCNPCNYYPRSVCKLIADRNMIPKFKEYYFKNNTVWNYPSDTYVAFVLNHYRLKYYMSIPFLVQHRDFKSNFKGRSRKRMTRYFIDWMTPEELEESGWKE